MPIPRRSTVCESSREPRQRECGSGWRAGRRAAALPTVDKGRCRDIELVPRTSKRPNASCSLVRVPQHGCFVQPGSTAGSVPEHVTACSRLSPQIVVCESVGVGVCLQVPECNADWNLLSAGKSAHRSDIYNDMTACNNRIRYAMCKKTA